MVKTKFKRAVSLVMAAVLSLGVFANIGTTAYAASGTKSNVYIMQLPRSGDTNNNGKWGHGELKFMNGWYSHAISTDSLRAMGSYSGNIAYCIEPGTGQHTGDTLTEKNEDYFNNLGSNGTISGDDIRLNIGRILQYGYCGSISTSWKSQNSDDADKLSHAIATQLLIWETIVGEMKVLIISRPAVMTLFSTTFKKVIPFIAVLWLTTTVCLKVYRSTQKYRVSVLSQAALQR